MAKSSSDCDTEAARSQARTWRQEIFEQVRRQLNARELLARPAEADRLYEATGRVRRVEFRDAVALRTKRGATGRRVSGSATPGSVAQDCHARTSNNAKEQAQYLEREEDRLRDRDHVLRRRRVDLHLAHTRKLQEQLRVHGQACVRQTAA